MIKASSKAASRLKLRTGSFKPFGPKRSQKEERETKKHLIMKRLFSIGIVLGLVMLLCGMPGNAGASERYTCKYCGSTASSIYSLTSGYCQRHPDVAGKGRHVPYEGDSNQKKYYCEYCGSSASSVYSLTAGNCQRHPNGAGKGHHKPYEGSEKSRYTCKYCGSSASSIYSLTVGNCQRHPNGAGKGHHIPSLH